MKLIVIGRLGGQKVLNWPLALLWVFLVGFAAALAAFLVVVFVDNSQLLPRADLDLVWFQSFLVPLAMLLGGIIPLWLRWRKPLDQLPDLEKAPPRFLVIKPFPWRTVLQRGVFGVAALATLVALFYAVENWRGKRAFLNHKRELAAQGQFLEIKDIVPPAVPDEQNLAMTPFFRGLLDYEHGPQGIIWHDPSSEQRLKKLASLLNSGGKEGHHLPAATNPYRNQLISLAAYQAFFRNSTNVPHASAPQTPAEDVLLALSACEHELSELRAAAASRPLTRFPIHYEDNVSCLLPHLSRLKSLVQYLQLHAVACLETKRVNEAFEDLQLSCRLADIPKTEPLLVSQLVRIACTSCSIQVIKEGLVRHAWNDEQLRWARDYCLKNDLLATVANSYNGERAIAIAGLDLVRQGKLSLRSLLSNDLPEPYTGVLQRPMEKLFPGGWYYQNMVSISQFYERYAENIIKPTGQKVDRVLAESTDVALQRTATTPYNFFAKVFTPQLVAHCIRVARSQTLLNHAAIACALEQYRLTHHRYPEKLEMLQPDFLSRLPNDVINGQPYSYRHEGDNYVLYATGWDLTDQGGKVAASSADNYADSAKGDWVWSLTPTPPIKLK